MYYAYIQKKINKNQYFIAVLMTNVSKVGMLNNVHFISDAVSEFNDGDKLMLEWMHMTRK